MSSLPAVYLPQKIDLLKIPLWKPDHRFVYMRLTEEQKRCGYVSVIVDSARFLDHWNCPCQKNIASMKNDRRLLEGHAESGFAEGCYNPVPLAAIGCILDGKIKLLNGVTRTLWLYINGARAFPVACPENIRKDIELLAGVDL